MKSDAVGGRRQRATISRLAWRTPSSGTSRSSEARFGLAVQAGRQAAEALVACNLLNQMTDMGRPDSYAIGR